MAQGILSGIGLGAVFSVGVAGAISVLVPMQPQPAPASAGAQQTPQISLRAPDANGTPPASPQISPSEGAADGQSEASGKAAQAPQVASGLSVGLDAPVIPNVEDAMPVTAAQMQTAALGPQPAPLVPLDPGAPQTSPQVTVPLPAPQAGAAGTLTVPRPLPQTIAPRAGEDAPVLPNPQALAPMIPDDSVDADIAADQPPPASPAPEQEQTVDSATSETEAAETENEAAEAGTGEQAPTEDEPTGEAAAAPKPRVLPAVDSSAAALGNDARVQVGRPAISILNRAGQNTGGAVETITQALSGDAADAPPLRRYAQPFENAEGKPLMSIVLMDTGADLDAAGVGLPALTSFPYPVSFAVDASLPDAFERVERYRAEGFDVLAMVDLPEGARASDAEVSLAVALNGLPEIVGILEGLGAGLQGSREVSDQVTGILKASGHGLVTQSKGLNSMPKLAVKEGVGAAAVFRDFDSEGQTPRVIRRFLDQAAFKAGQEEGGVIMLGRLRPETIEALLVWGLADRAGSVALAPVSAVLLDQR